MKKVMLKVLLVSGCCMLMVFSANAETGKSYGFKVSGGIARMGGDATTDTDVSNKFGFSVGAFFEAMLNENFSVQPEILYVQRGVKKKGSYDDGFIMTEWEEDDKFSYIQVPVLIKFNIPTEGKLKPSLFVGPSLALNMTAKSTGTFGDSEAWDGDIPNVKSLDFSGIFGGGLTFMMGTTTLFFDVRYDMSLGTAFDDMTQEELDDLGEDEVPFILEDGTAEDLKHKSFTASFGIKIPIK